MTPKALSNSSPGLLQPWDLCNQGIITLKVLANGGPCVFANSFRVREEGEVAPQSQGCSNPGLELANAFSVIRTRGISNQSPSAGGSDYCSRLLVYTTAAAST